MEAQEFRARMVELLAKLDTDVTPAAAAKQPKADQEQARENIADRVTWAAIRYNCCYACTWRDLDMLYKVTPTLCFAAISSLAEKHAYAHKDGPAERWVLRSEARTRELNPDVPLYVVWHAVGRAMKEMALGLLAAGVREFDADQADPAEIILTEVTGDNIPAPVSATRH